MNRFRRIVLVLLMAVCVISLTGSSCSVKTPDIPTAVEGGKQISADFKDGATAMAEGLAAAAGVDPAGINRLLDEVKTRDELIAKLQEEIRRARSRPDVVNLSGASRFQVEIVSYSGSIRLHGWVDSPENQFYTADGCLLVDREVFLDMPFNIARATRDSKILPQLSKLVDNKVPFQWALTTADEIDAAYEQAARESLKRFQGKPRIVPSVACRSQDVDVRLQGKGEHKIFLQVTPETLNAGGRWSVEYQVAFWEEDKKETTLKKVATGRFDSEKRSTFEVGTSLPSELVAKFFVHYE